VLWYKQGNFVARAYNTGQNINTGITVFLIYESGISVYQKQTFFSIHFDDRCNDVRKNQVTT
jgi:hypothetical protein